MEIAQIVAQRIKAARKAKGWSRASLASRLGLDYTERAVVSWERAVRTPPAETIAVLADVLGVSRGYLMGDPAGDVPTEAEVVRWLGTADGAEVVLGALTHFVRSKR